MNPHNWVTALDPPGNYDRRWQCQYCKATGKLAELKTVECSYVYPPCTSCGQTPTCAADCALIIGLLMGSRSPTEGKPS